MDRYILDDGRFDGVMEILHVDPETLDVVVETIADAEPVIESNKNRKNHSFGFARNAAIRPIAELDLGTVTRWLSEGVDIFDRNCDKDIRRKLKEEPVFSVAPNRTASGIIISGDR